MIEFGGDMVTGDAPPQERDAADSPENDEAGWRITEPLSGRTFYLTNAAISTSGDTVQFAVIDGTRYSHVLDPRTGIPLTSRIAVTVIAPEGILSDGLATMLSVLGPEEGIPLVEHTWPDVQVFFDHAGEEK
jgi:thiamine biosynthesis lipoprotein